MRTSDAAGVVAVLLAAFPDAALDESSVELWAREIARLDSAACASDVAFACARRDTHFPSLAAFRSAYSSERRRQLDEQAKSGLEEPRPTVLPEWVKVWRWARNERVPREERGFPQQYGSSDPLALMAPVEYESLRDEWQEAGAPAFAVADLASVRSGA